MGQLKSIGQPPQSSGDKMLCQNCDQVIDRLGEAFVWLDRPVCKACFKRLAATRSVRYRSFWMPVALVSIAAAITLAVILGLGAVNNKKDEVSKAGGADQASVGGDRQRQIKSQSESSTVFVSDLEEQDSKIWQYGKKGWGASMGRLKLSGVNTPNGIGMHPSRGQTGGTSFKLPGAFREFRSEIGINDSAGNNPESPIVFRVLGDGKMLWESRPISKWKESHPVAVNITGVKVLGLQISIDGDHTNAHAVWIEPSVLR